MHIAATNQLGIRPEEIPQEIIDKEMEIYMAQAKETGKPENILEKIAQGKLQKFIKENSLMDQPYVRNPDMTVADLLNELIAKIGENITVKRFTRFQVGQA
jgi:elongation factor Ts